MLVCLTDEYTYVSLFPGRPEKCGLHTRVEEETRDCGIHECMMETVGMFGCSSLTIHRTISVSSTTTSPLPVMWICVLQCERPTM